MRVKSTQPPGFAADLIGSRAYLGFNYLERSKCQIPKSEEMIEGILAGSPFRSEPQVGKPPLPQQLAHMARKQATGRGGATCIKPRSCRLQPRRGCENLGRHARLRIVCAASRGFSP